MGRLIDIAWKALGFIFTIIGWIIHFLWRGILMLIDILAKLPWGYIGKGIVVVAGGTLLFYTLKAIISLIGKGIDNVQYNISVKHRLVRKKAVRLPHKSRCSLLPEIKAGLSRIKKRIRHQPVLKKQLSLFLGKKLLKEVQKVETRKKHLSKEISYLCQNKPAAPIFVNPAARDHLPGRGGGQESSRIQQEIRKIDLAARDYGKIIDQYSEEEGVLEVRLENIRRQVKGVEAVIIGHNLTRERITENAPLLRELEQWKQEMQRNLEDLFSSDNELAEDPVFPEGEAAAPGASTGGRRKRSLARGRRSSRITAGSYR